MSNALDTLLSEAPLPDINPNANTTLTQAQVNFSQAASSLAMLNGLQTSAPAPVPEVKAPTSAPTPFQLPAVQPVIPPYVPPTIQSQLPKSPLDTSLLYEYYSGYGKSLMPHIRKCGQTWIDRVAGILLGTGLGIKLTPVLKGHEILHETTSALYNELIDTIDLNAPTKYAENTHWSRAVGMNGHFVIPAFCALFAGRSGETLVGKLEASLTGERNKDILHAYVLCAILQQCIRPPNTTNWDNVFRVYIPRILNHVTSYLRDDMKLECQEVIRLTSGDCDKLLEVTSNASIFRNAILFVRTATRPNNKDKPSDILSKFLINTEDRATTMYNTMVVCALYGGIFGLGEVVLLANVANLNISDYEKQVKQFLLKV